MAIINKTKIRSFVDLNVSDEVEKELEKMTEDVLLKAQERARENGRRTIFSRDL